MQAMLLAAGLGVRLDPLTQERPKPALPVGQRPLLAYSLEWLARGGVSRVVINAFHLPDWIERAAASSAPPGVSVEVVREAPLLGTGGGVRNLWEHLEENSDPVVVCNADILFRPNLRDALRTHERLGAVATMVVRTDPNASVYGAVEIDASQRVRRLLGVPSFDEPLSTTMFTGVHILSPRARDDLPRDGCIVRRSYRRWIDRGEPVGGCVDTSTWMDLGTPLAYHRANLDLAFDAGFAADLDVAPAQAVHPSAQIHPDAILDQCVVGAGATVGPVHLRRCVVFDGACVVRDAQDTVLGRRHNVVVGSGS